MWVEELRLDNIKCFAEQTIKLGSSKEPYKWVTLLGENGTGKTTILQALALLLAGPEGAKQLLSRPLGWLKDESKVGKISTVLHQNDNDEGIFGGDKQTRQKFGYTFHITGSKPIVLRSKTYNEPTIVENSDKILGWLRNNVLLPQGKTWFAAGYGAFRRLTRENRIITPTLQAPSRYSNFFTQFQEDKPLEAFETWLVFLDYKIAKNQKDTEAVKQKEMGIKAIEKLLPAGNSFSKIDENGQIWFNVQGNIVPTIALSDGFRSIMALTGDLIWRLIEAFPKSNNPLEETGVVLIDELDIHLHPVWQRDIASKLQNLFPNLQFIMATHSPLVASGTGDAAKTYRCYKKEGQTHIEEIANITHKSVDEILTSEAFGLVSEYSPQTQEKIDKYNKLKRKPKRSESEEQEFGQLSLFVKKVLNDNLDPVEEKMDAYIANFFNNQQKPPTAK